MSKWLFLATITGGSTIIGRVDIGAVVLSLGGMIALSWYEVHRKFKKDKIDGMWDFVDRNFVRLIFASIIAPNAVRSVVDLVTMLK